MCGWKLRWTKIMLYRPCRRTRLQIIRAQALVDHAPQLR
jgi:hypothetical protein